MWSWAIEYWNSLPSLGWLILFVGGGFSASFFLELYLQSKNRKESPRTSEDLTPGEVLVVFLMFGGLGDLLITGGASLVQLIERTVFAGFSQWVGFQMMGMGVLLGIFIFHGPEWACAAWHRISLIWSTHKGKRENDPRRILARCRKQFTHAQSRRIQIPMEEARRPDSPDVTTSVDKITEVVGFDQAGANLLEFLGQLFQLIRHIDEFGQLSTGHKIRRARSEAIFKDVSSAQLITLLGIDTFDGAVLEQWRQRAQTIIEAVVLYFDELPAHVAAANIYYEAMQIKGLQEHLAKSLPKTTSSTGIIAELETGKLQSRLLDELMGRPAEVVPVPTAPHASEASPRPRLVGGGGSVRKR